MKLDKKVFISHSSKDSDLAMAIRSLLIFGFEIKDEGIFCSSNTGDISVGNDFNDDITVKMKGSEVIFLLITNNYTRSPFCMAELGAAWILNDEKMVLPVFVGDKIEKSAFLSTPIKNIQVIKYGDRESWISAYKRMLGVITPRVKFDNQFLLYFKSIEEMKDKTTTINNECRVTTIEENKFIIPDEAGYYHTTIVEKRMVPKAIRTHRYWYRIDGLIEPNDKTVESGENHWLFYFYDAYEELEANDIVRFRLVELCDLKTYNNEISRNIYPTDLAKQEDGKWVELKKAKILN